MKSPGQKKKKKFEISRGIHSNGKKLISLF